MIVTLVTEEGPAHDKIAALAKSLDAARVRYRLIDADTPEGGDLAELYDITRRPAVLVTQDDGVMTHLWQGALPSPSELEYSTH